MWGWLLFVYNVNGIFTFIFLPMYLYLFLIDSVHLPPIIVRLYWKMPAESSVDEGKELYIPGSSERLDSRKGGPDTPPGIQHIINKNHPLILNYKIYTGLIGFQWFTAPPEIITVECDIQLPHKNILNVVVVF